MEEKHKLLEIIEILSNKKYGAYKLLIEHYKEKIEGYKITVAIELIQKDIDQLVLEKRLKKVKLVYITFIQAYRRVFNIPLKNNRKSENLKQSGELDIDKIVASGEIPEVGELPKTRKSLL